MERSVVILADGTFPQHEIPLGYLRSSKRIICCDGAVVKMDAAGIEPFAIVGDMDSVPEDLAIKYGDKMHQFDDQDSNDLTKAVLFAIENGAENITIIGATGMREDHTLGNISLLMDYCDSVDVKMVTDKGIFIPLTKASILSSWPGQKVSIFTNNPQTEITSLGLKYPLNNLQLLNWWVGSLNESIADNIEILFTSGRVLVFLGF